MKLNKLFAMLAAPALLLCGCNNDKTEDDAADIRTISVTTSKTEVAVTDDNLAEELLEISWSDESRYIGTVSYTLEIALSNGTASPYTAAGIGSKSKSFTGEDMRSLLFGLGVGVGERAELKATVSAVAGGSTVNRSAAVTFAAVVEGSELEPIVLAADPLTVVLRDEEGEALGFEWSDPNSYKESVTYRLELDVTGNGFATADIRETGSASLSYTNSELNELLLDKWHGEAGIVSTLDARVSAVAGGSVQTVSQTVCIDVTPYGTALEYSAMALYGTAAGSEELAMTKGEGQKFTFSGYLAAGDVYFRCNPDGTDAGDWFVAAEAGKTIVSGAAETVVSAPAGSDRTAAAWTVKDEGVYTVELDVEQRTVVFTLDRKIYSAIGMVGPATPKEWDANYPEMFTRDGFKFEWEGELKAGTMRFLCEPDPTKGWEVDQYIASERDKPVVSGETERLVLAAVAQSGRGDNMWVIGTPGKWHISLDLESQTGVFTLLEGRGKYDGLNAVHMAGDATPGGWDAGKMEPLSKEGNCWKWSGRLNTGEIKFICNRTDDRPWGEYGFLALAAGDPVTADNFVKKYTTSGDDWKWNITAAGTYDITIDLDAEEITFALKEQSGGKYDDLKTIHMVGPATPGGWDASKMEPLEKDGNGWKWSGHLNSDEIKFVCNHTGDDWGTYQLQAQKNGQPVGVNNKAMKFNKGGDDNKWRIEVAGEYEIAIDLENETVTYKLITPDKKAADDNYPSLGMIGDAAPQGWSFDYTNSTLERQEDGTTYLWKGRLNSGSLQIFCDTTDTAWGSPRLTAVARDFEIESGDENLMHYKQDDNGWKITVEGEYTVKVDLLRMTVVFTLANAR